MNKFIKKLLAMRIMFGLVGSPVNTSYLENRTMFLPETHPTHVDNIRCEFCQSIVSILERRINFANQTVDEIEKIVKRICSLMLNKEKREVCYKIDEDIDEIKNMIIGGLDRKEICYKMGLCK